MERKKRKKRIIKSKAIQQEQSSAEQVAQQEEQSHSAEPELALQEVAQVAESPLIDSPSPEPETGNPPPDSPIEPEVEHHKRNNKKIIFAMILFILGGLLAYWGNSIVQIFLIIFGFGVMAGSFFLFKNGWKEGSIRIIGAVDKTGKGMVVSPFNSNALLLRPKKLEFEKIEDFSGQRKKCHNDGKWYYVMVETNNDGKLNEFELPDNSEKEIYYDPAEFANVLNMPANKRLFEYLPSNFQKIAIGIMAAICAGELITLIALSGGNSGG